MFWRQIHAPTWKQSPSSRVRVCAEPFFTRAVGEQCVCVHRVSSAPLTALNEPGQGAVSAGYLAPSANPSAPASGGAASKPGPDSSEEWMLIFFFQLRILIMHSSRLDYETEIRLTEIWVYAVAEWIRYVTLVLARKFLHPKLKYH